MKIFLKPFISMLLISLMAGCADLQKLGTPVERKVVDNQLYSNKYPKAVISISNNISYEGMIPDTHWARFTDDPSGAAIETNKYLFIAADNKQSIDQFLIVDFAKSMAGQWRSGFKKGCCVETGEANLDGQYFDTALFGFIADNPDDSVIEFLKDANYGVPTCLMGKIYDKIYGKRHSDKNMKVSIFYAEPIDCDQSVMFSPENRQEGKTEAYIKAFNQRADNSFIYTHL